MQKADYLYRLFTGEPITPEDIQKRQKDLAKTARKYRTLQHLTEDNGSKYQLMTLILDQLY